MSEANLSAEQLMEQIPARQRRVLEHNHFDAAEFLELRRAYLAGELGEEDNRLDATVEQPGEADVRTLPIRDTDQAREYIQLGKEAIANGEVGIVVLNGGMATRFGGVVKGCVTVFDDLSFIGLKALDVRRHGAGTKMLLMNSFATEDKTRQHLEEHDYFGMEEDQLIQFNQNVSIRLTPDGDLFREEDGSVSLYAPGHGDLPSAIGRGALQAFRQAGGKYLLMSNVDNVLATVDPLVVGMHVDAAAHGAEMTVEAVQKKVGQVGGFVARVDGEPQVVEHFRIPEPSLKDELQLLNTNTFMFNADALDDDFDLTWFVVDKKVDSQTAIQFERLAGELSAFLDTTFVEVPATGEEARFQPIKRREDLDDNRDRLERIVKQRVLL